MSITEGDYQQAATEMLQLAVTAIAQRLGGAHHSEISLDNVSPILQQSAACFVTLYLHGQLRGCIGHLQAIQPLAKDIVENAQSAAFADPRFAPLTGEEFHALDIHISILTPAEKLSVNTRDELLQNLQKDRDGLILQEGHRQATFLPSVWQQLPDKESFLRHLLQKGGWPADYWSDNMQASIYHSIEFADSVNALQSN